MIKSVLFFRVFVFLFFFFGFGNMYAQCPAIANAGTDQFICNPTGQVILNGSVANADCFEWSPSAGLSDPTILNPTVAVTGNTTYTLSAFTADNTTNLVTNGDFEQGNTNFTSDYTYNPTTFALYALYTIITSPSLISSNLPPCTDHTSGVGNLLLVRGDSSPGGSFWCQNIPVTPNTNYLFSYWISTVVPIDPATVQLSVNNQLITPTYTASPTSCFWELVEIKWNSGANTSADFCLTSQSTSLFGNTFAIDDIGLYEMCEITDQVDVGIIDLQATLPPLNVLPCDGTSITLTPTNYSTGNGITYNWFTPNGNIVGPSNIPNITVNQPGTYTFTLSYSDGIVTCNTPNTTTVIADPDVPMAFASSLNDLDCNNLTATLSGIGSSQGGNITYNWTTNDGNIISGASSLFPEVNQVGTYTLTVTNTTNNCFDTADVTVFSDFTLPIANAITPVQIGCGNSNLNLDGSGSSTVASYQWISYDGNIVNGTNTLNPEVNQAGSYTLIVTSATNGCIDSTSVVVNGSSDLPIANAGADASVDCNTTQLQLDGSQSSTGNNYSYDWTTSDGSFVGSNSIISPSINQAGTYILEVINSDNNCNAFDTILVIDNAIYPIAEAGNPITLTCTFLASELAGSGSSGANIEYEWTTANGCISANANTLMPTIDAPGDYDLTITNTDNGCATTDNVTIIEDIQNPIAEAGNSFQIDCDNSTPNTLDGSASSSGAGFEYQWTTSNGNFVSPNNINAPEINQAGTYLLEVTDSANGCTATDSVVITQNSDVPFINIETANALSCDSSSIMLNANASDMGANIQLNWTTPNGNFLANQNSYTPTIDIAAEYVLTLTNTDNNCSVMDTVTVMENTIFPAVEAGNPITLTCTLIASELTGSGSSGANIEYEWTTANGCISANANTLTPTVDAPGDYQLIITNTENGCTSTDNVIVLQDTINPVAEAGASFEIDCDTSTPNTLDGSASSAGVDFVYQWTTNDGSFVDVSNINTPEISLAGTYILMVTDTISGCTAIDSVIIIQNSDIPFVNIETANALSCDSSSIVLNASASDMGANIQLNWTTVDGNFLANQNSYTPTIDIATDYFLTLTNTDNNCSASTVVTVPIDTLSPIANAGADDTYNCIHTLFDLNGLEASGSTANLGYQWNTSNGNLIGNSNQLNTQADINGDYTLTITNTDNGCSDADMLTIELDTLAPIANAGADFMLDCITTQQNIDGSASSIGAVFLYEWSTNDGNIVGMNNEINPLIDAQGIYILEVNNSNNGCTAIDSITVTANADAPTAFAGLPDTLNCANPTLQLQGSGSMGNEFTYNWATSNGNITADANTLNPTIDEAGTYELTILNTSNNCDATAMVVIDEDFALPSAEAGDGFELTCNATAYELNGSASAVNASFDFEWTSATGNFIANANQLNPTVNAAGSYILTVTDLQNQCIAQDSAIIMQDANLPIANAGTTLTLDCLTNQLNLDGSNSSTNGNFAFAWTTSDGNIVSGADGLTPMVDSAGIYTLTVTDLNNNCDAVASVEVLDGAIEPTIIIITPDSINCSNSMVNIDASGSDTGSQFTYYWLNNLGMAANFSNPQIPTVTEAGVYTLTIQNVDNGCSNSQTVQVHIDTIQPNIVLQANGLIDCLNPSQSISTTSSSFGNEYLYNWATSDGNFDDLTDVNNPIVDAGGTYILSIINQLNGCQNTENILINEDITVPIISINPPQMLSCIHEEVLLTCNADGNNYEYNWTSANGGMLTNTDMATTTASDPDTYTCFVTNPLNGCTADTFTVVTQNIMPPTLLLASDFPAITCDIVEINISSTVNDTDDADLLTWTTTNGNIAGSTTDMDVLVSSSGLYELAVINTINGCSAMATLDILEDTTPPSVNAGAMAMLDCGAESTVLDATSGTAQGSNFVYEWTGNSLITDANTLMPTIDQIGIYTLNVLNTENGCSNEDDIQVIENEPTIVDFETSDATCADARGSLLVGNVIGGTTPYIYSVNGVDFVAQANFGNLNPGAYELTVQDANGCELESTFVINEATALEISLPEELEVSLGDSIQLVPLLNINASLVDSVAWRPATFLNCDTCLMPYSKPLETVAYDLFIQDENGCTSTAQITIIVDERPAIYIPSAFSPREQDGQNDVFYINARKGSVAQIQSLNIYSRWGQVVFNSQNTQPNDANAGWDGVYEGQLMNSAVFTYQAIIQMIDGRLVEMTGDLVLK